MNWCVQAALITLPHLSALLSLSSSCKLLGTCFKSDHHPLVSTNDSMPGSRGPRPGSSNGPLLKLAAFHKQFHQLVTQLGVYWKMADFDSESCI